MAYHQVTQEEFNRVDALMNQLKGRESHNHPAETMTELFNIHNICFPQNPEYSRACSGCRVRVYNRMVTYWNDMKGNYGF